MRIAIASVLAAVVSAATISVSIAASLSGSPFVIREDPGDRWVIVAAFDNTGGEFAVLYSEAHDTSGPLTQVSFRLFDALGKPRSAKTKIYDGSSKPDALVIGGGWLPLSNKNTLVALASTRREGDGYVDNGWLDNSSMERPWSATGIRWIDRRSAKSSPQLFIV